MTRRSPFYKRLSDPDVKAEADQGDQGGPPPIARMLAALKPHERLQGDSVEQALQYSNLLDLLASGMDTVFEDATARTALLYAELATFIRGLDFASLGVGIEDRVACLLPSGPEAAVFLMCCFAKCTVVPLNPLSTQQEIVTDANRVQAKALVAHRDYLQNPKQYGELTGAAEELRVCLFELTPNKMIVGKFALKHIGLGRRKPAPLVTNQLFSSMDDRSLMLFTSGTSGSKKCVPYTLNTLVIGASCIIGSWELVPKDKVCNMMPLFHIGGIARNVLSPVLSGGSAVLCGSFDLTLFWDIVEREHAVTWYYAAPVMHQMLLDEFQRRGLKHSFRFVANAAGSLLPSLALSMREAYKCSILPGYGMTECMPISAPPLDYRLDRKGTSGRRVGPELKIFDDQGSELGHGTIGNIVVKGAPLFSGYEGDAAATAEAFFPGGWFNTGDMGWIDKDGYLYVTGQSKEVINRGGEIISPFEIEEAMQSHPRLKQVLAFSVPHEVLEQGVGLAVVLEDDQPSVCLRSVQQWCKKSLTFAKWPQVLVVMDDLPRNHSNKPLRIKLAERLDLRRFWGAGMVDGMPEIARTFLADCPPKGTALREPIANVRRLSLDHNALGRRLVDAGRDLGVKEAVVSEVGSDLRLCACVTPACIDTNELIRKLRGSWDDWDIPIIVTALPELPRSSAKLGDDVPPVDRERLLRLLEVLDPDYIAPSNRFEEVVQQIWERCLQKPRISVDADFFDVGGTSLLIGPLALCIQEELKVAVTAVDLFNASTIQSIAALASSRKDADDTDRRAMPDSGSHTALTSWTNRALVDVERSWSSTHPIVLFVQALPVLLIRPALRFLYWVFFIYLFIYLEGLHLTSVPSSGFCHLLVSILLTRLVFAVLIPFIGITSKWLVVGVYKEAQFPLFGSSYLRWWFVSQILRITGKGIFMDLGMSLWYYRLMGASIGSGVKLGRRGLEMSEFDLITIGSDVALDQCFIRPFAMNPNMSYSLSRIHIGDGSSVSIKSVIAGGARLPAGSSLGPLSSSHELMDSRPENRASCTALREDPPLWLRLFCGWPVLILQQILACVPVLFVIKRMTSESWYDNTLSSISEGMAYLTTPMRMLYIVAMFWSRAVLYPCISLAVAILAKWLIIGKFEETPHDKEPDASPWQLFRVWLMGELIPDPYLCGVTKLLGRHYEAVSFLYRLLGAKVGRYVYWPGSGMRFLEPDLVEIGDFVVFGSRSVFCTSDASNRRQAIRLEAGSNVSDRCVLLPGTTVKCGAILGSGTLTKQGGTYEAGTYVGSHGNDCMVLKKAIGDQQLPTSSPYSRAFSDRRSMPYTVLPECMHVFWSTGCIMLATCLHRLPIVASLLLAHRHFDGFWQGLTAEEIFVTLCGYFFCTYYFVLLVSLSLDICSKWCLMGKREPGVHAWDTSSYNQRWQLYLSLAPVKGHESDDILDFLRGTQYLVWYFRMLGAQIGKNVCLYPNGADPMMTEPDLVSISDGACVDDAALISHLNTQGVFTINHLRIGEKCVLRLASRLQQSGVMESKSVLMEHTLVLPADTVKANEWRQGWPAGQGWVME